MITFPKSPDKKIRGEVQKSDQEKLTYLLEREERHDGESGEETEE